MTSKLSFPSAVLLFVAPGVLVLASPGFSQEGRPVDFETQVRPVLAAYCYECHGANAATREADLRVDKRRFAFADLGGYHAIVPGEPAESELYMRLTSEFAEDRMPPYSAGLDLDVFEIDIIRRWIAEGADWPEDVDQREPLPARPGGYVAGLPAVELPERPVVINTHEIKEVRLRVLTQELSHPWSMAFLTRGDILITERAGRLRLYRDGVLIPDAIEGVPTDILARGLSGLMEVAAHPDFEDNGLVYLTYTRRLDGGHGTVALVRGRFDGNVLRDVEDLFVAEPWMGQVAVDDPNVLVGSTAAARLAFAPDGKLFMTLGGAFGVERDDGGSSFFGLALLAQDLTSHAGKLLRLYPDGSVPDDNPFVGRAGAKSEIYSMGHRNQQGLALHPETGVPYAIEHGVQGGDELNAIEAGGNYGWPLVSYSRHYEGPRIAKQFWNEGFKEPLVLWVPSIGPSGLAFYTGDAFPQWHGNLFAGSLQEGSIPRTGHVERIVFNRSGEEIRRESLLAEFRQRIRDVRQGPDGLIYILTEQNRAALLRLEPVEDSGR